MLLRWRDYPAGGKFLKKCLYHPHRPLFTPSDSGELSRRVWPRYRPLTDVLNLLFHYGMPQRNRPEHPVRAVLAARRISYADLAEGCGYSPAYVEGMCNGRVMVSDEFARRASQALDLPMDELFAGMEPVATPPRRGKAKVSSAK